MPWLEVAPIEIAAPDTIVPGRVIDPKSSEEIDPKGFEEYASDPTMGFADLSTEKRYVALYPKGFDAGHGLVSVDPDSSDGHEEDADLVPKGWADNNGNGVGEDDRTNQSGSILSQYTRLGRLTASCSATMVRQTANGHSL